MSSIRNLALLLSALTISFAQPTDSADNAPRPLLQGGVVIPLYAPDSPFLKKDRLGEPEQFT